MPAECPKSPSYLGFHVYSEPIEVNGRMKMPERDWCRHCGQPAPWSPPDTPSHAEMYEAARKASKS